jgi:uncharacterized membrane protein YsdA (DUF1294 family)
MTPQLILYSLFGLVNLLAFSMMLYDKHKSIRGNTGKRSPEGLLFFYAIIGGGLGVYLGMFVARHKTKKWYFKLGVPVLFAQQVALLFLLQDYFGWNILFF